MFTKRTTETGDRMDGMTRGGGAVAIAKKLWLALLAVWFVGALVGAGVEDDPGKRWGWLGVAFMTVVAAAWLAVALWADSIRNERQQG